MGKALTRLLRLAKHSSEAIKPDSQSPPGRFSFAMLTTRIWVLWPLPWLLVIPSTEPTNPTYQQQAATAYSGQTDLSTIQNLLINQSALLKQQDEEIASLTKELVEREWQIASLEQRLKGQQQQIEWLGYQYAYIIWAPSSF